MNKKLVIIGTGETADIAYEYFSVDSDREVVAFAVEKQYLKVGGRFDLPIMDLDRLVDVYPPDLFDVFVAISYVQLNRVRERLFLLVKSWGYKCATYISSRAFVWRTAKIGENCFIFENNVVQHGAVIEDNVILWSGNHVGHQSIIRQSAYVASHVVISGFCEIGPRSFIGVNAAIVDGVSIGADCMIAASAMIATSTDLNNAIYIGNPAIRRPRILATRYFGVRDN
jgi:sugar O-acyltransferase (sialic acid O-acetyltransferase NeuD family)